MFSLEKKQILLIEDNPHDAILFQEYLKQDKEFCFIFKQCRSIRSGLHYYINMDIDCVILDYRLDDGDGLTLLNDLRARGSLKSPIIFVTSFATEELKNSAMSAGAFLFLDKNKIDQKILNQAIYGALHKHEPKKSQAT